VGPLLSVLTARPATAAPNKFGSATRKALAKRGMPVRDTARGLTPPSSEQDTARGLTPSLRTWLLLRVHSRRDMARGLTPAFGTRLSYRGGGASPAMSLGRSAVEGREIIAGLLKKGARANCPMCDATRWVDTGDTGRAVLAIANATDGIEEFRPVVWICDNCGFVRMHDERKLL